jgi:hypothetical protein
MNTGASRSGMLTSVAGGRPDRGTARFHSVRMASVRRVTTDMGLSIAVVFLVCGPVPNLPPAGAQPPARAGCASNRPPYRIRIGDIFDILHRRNPALNEEVTVQPDGRISAVVVADQLAYWLTAAELHAAHCGATIPRADGSRA